MLGTLTVPLIGLPGLLVRNERAQMLGTPACRIVGALFTFCV